MIGGTPLVRAIETEVAARVATSTRALSDELAAVRHFAEVDQLTGIANRRMGLQALEASAALEAPTGVAMFDIDHFKRINDTFGHATGDDALVAVAGVLRAEAAKHGGTAARLGGEEFAMVLPGHGVTAAHQAALDALEGIRQLRVPARDGSVLELTASAGVTASTSAPVTTGNAVNDLLGHADALLYEAKHAGRNRAVTPSLAPR